MKLARSIFPIRFGVIACLSLLLPIDELPIEHWIEQSIELETLALRYEINKEGEKSTAEFLYDSAGRGYFSSGKKSSGWIDDQKVLFVSPDNEIIFYDIGDRVEDCLQRLDDLCEQLESEIDHHFHLPQPALNIWSDAVNFFVRFDLQLLQTHDGPFVWLHALDESNFDVTPVENGFELLDENGTRIVLGKKFGIPTSILSGEGEQRRELRLLEMEVNENVDIPEMPTGGEDRSEHFASLFLNLERKKVYSWLWKWQEERGFQIEEDEREILNAYFMEFYLLWDEQRNERRTEESRQIVQNLLADVGAWYEGYRDAPDAEEAFEAARIECERITRVQHTERVEEILKGLAPEPVWNVSAEDLEPLLELERDGARIYLNEHFVEPALEYLTEGLDQLN